LQLLESVRTWNAISRAALCTLARRGVAYRQAEPTRAARWLDYLSSHPLFKGGQFLFDLLEWEDFMLDGPPPALVDQAEILALLQRIAAAIGNVVGQKAFPTTVFETTRATDATPFPPLEPGFYLYRDVILGTIASMCAHLESVETTLWPKN
jgi:hypothetical protein